MQEKIDPAKVRGEEVSQVEEIAGESMYRCYQCGKCSAACPATPEMDMLPSQVIRYLQLGLPEKVLKANTPWICASCLQCMTVCPKGVDLSKIMEGVRMMQLRHGENRIEMREFDEEYRKRAPQIAFISGLRKFQSLS
ncbi:MAG: heterodisulfide reductase [Deltaproteobacteria bacterium]|nr:MAG: heterodisulfide reductase [Deltaproteobacteria bacterium]